MDAPLNVNEVSMKDSLLLQYTSNFVRQEGSEMEQFLKQSTKVMHLLPFLQDNHPYNAYYNWLKSSPCSLIEPHLVPAALQNLFSVSVALEKEEGGHATNEYVPSTVSISIEEDNDDSSVNITSSNNLANLTEIDHGNCLAPDTSIEVTTNVSAHHDDDSGGFGLLLSGYADNFDDFDQIEDSCDRDSVSPEKNHTISDQSDLSIPVTNRSESKAPIDIVFNVDRIPPICWTPPTPDLKISNATTRVIEQIAYILLTLPIENCHKLEKIMDEKSELEFLRPSTISCRYFQYVIRSISKHMAKENFAPPSPLIFEIQNETSICLKLIGCLQFDSLMSSNVSKIETNRITSEERQQARQIRAKLLLQSMQRRE